VAALAKLVVPMSRALPKIADRVIVRNIGSSLFSELDFNRSYLATALRVAGCQARASQATASENQINADEEAEQPKAGRWPSAKDHGACWNSEQAGRHHDPIGSAPDADTDA
jgi:hypothetical protein